MAARLADAGNRLVVFDPNATPVRALVDEHGARSAGSPREVAAQATVVFSCLPSEETAREAILGSDGVVEGLREGAGLVESSTVSPDTARELADGARARGAQAIDASVSGSTAPAEQGQLVLLVGGDRELYDRCRPLLETLAKARHYMGPSGAGATTKVVVNAILGANMQVLAEAYALGIKAGLDPPRLQDVLRASDAVAVAHQSKVDNIAKGDYPVAFALRLMHKDFGLVQDLAESVQAVMPATAVAQQLNAAEQAKGREEDFSAVGALMLELSAAPNAR
jgi:2-hydroxy-3-oxopropionate reductase